jgi:pimeloyl-ACP methyl ester carboxylesterase
MYETTVLGGVKMAYLDSGAVPGAPTLLFLHGLGTYALSWRHNLQSLRTKARCIAVDLPGHGASGRGSYSYTMRFFAKCVIDLIGKLGLSDVWLVGHSMGGQIALTAVLEEPRCATRLVLCAPAGFETFNPIERATQLASARMMDVFYDDEATLRAGIQASFNRFPSDAQNMVSDLIKVLRRQPKHEHRLAMERCITGMMDGSVYDKLHAVKQPALVMFGEKDKLIPAKVFSQRGTRDVAKEGTRRMPAATLHMVPQVGHFVHWEAANEVNGLISRWLDDKKSS